MNKNGLRQINLVLAIRHLNDLNAVLDKIKQLDNVLEVRRVTA
jgi:(p)ppGpp synthase/HD superfamily hydrolase